MKFLAAALGILGIIALIVALSLVVTFIPAVILYLIAVKALNLPIHISFWEAYWGTYLIVFIGNLLFGGIKVSSK
ncbi:hypothetical protein BH780_gp161 [Bacillus phage Eldridge]|uniref:Uncharacterized protein n=1 Tax=Bacillus phage Eldridge TaxID=1776293 RepID=A0A120HUP9_9CAUD|nr:hypothetical protein BH780_gp161 [Bacillus phage Eldridge]AMB18744.1 hypothetical protein Eldridge_0164 [Bacillus phage Eldridge]